MNCGEFAPSSIVSAFLTVSSPSLLFSLCLFSGCATFSLWFYLPPLRGQKCSENLVLAGLLALAFPLSPWTFQILASCLLLSCSLIEISFPSLTVHCTDQKLSEPTPLPKDGPPFGTYYRVPFTLGAVALTKYTGFFFSSLTLIIGQ